jgi:hypothetical protein
MYPLIASREGWHQSTLPVVIPRPPRRFWRRNARQRSPLNSDHGRAGPFQARKVVKVGLAERFIVPWTEAEARIAFQRWKEFPPVQPLQLHDARRSLAADNLIVEEVTHHHPPVTTIRLPFPPGRKRELERLRGERRKAYRTYLSWAQDSRLCGKHAERVVLESAQSAASDAGLWVPPQVVGEIHTILGASSSRGPLDEVVYAHVLADPKPTADAILAVEVKNIHTWIYPWSKELWELLVKAAEVALDIPVMPLAALRQIPDGKSAGGGPASG